MNFAIVRYLIGWLMGIESLFLLLPRLPRSFTVNPSCLPISPPH